jgi:hypothetical protein
MGTTFSFKARPVLARPIRPPTPSWKCSPVASGLGWGPLTGGPDGTPTASFAFGRTANLLADIAGFTELVEGHAPVDESLNVADHRVMIGCVPGDRQVAVTGHREGHRTTVSIEAQDFARRLPARLPSPMALANSERRAL